MKQWMMLVTVFISTSGSLSVYSTTRYVWRAQNWVSLALDGTNPGLFKIRFLYILARRAKMYWNLIWKSFGLVPFGANRKQFGPNLTLTSLNQPLDREGHCSRVNRSSLSKTWLEKLISASWFHLNIIDWTWMEVISIIMALVSIVKIPSQALVT